MTDPCTNQSTPLLTLDDALERIQTEVNSISGIESVALAHGHGRILANDIFSDIHLPFDNNAAMDGYAIASADIDRHQSFNLNLAGVSWAGKPYTGTIALGQCIRIFTGAVVPTGLDTVVMQENVVVNGTSITFPAGILAGDNVRLAGEEIKSGDLLMKAPKKLQPADIGLLAAAGIEKVKVKRKLKIAFFTTGDELMSLDQAPESGKIYDSNRYALAALLTDACFELIDWGVIPDNKLQLEDSLKQAALENDVIISTGGASVGEADYMNDILSACGHVSLWKIAVKPGKPLLFGALGACYFFGLPGNPVSMMVAFKQVVLPALTKLSGGNILRSIRILATCTTPLKKSPGRLEFQRGILTQTEEGSFFVASTGSQGSHIISSMSRGNCFILLPAESNGVQPGEKVIVEPFDKVI
jgi:molybdopterin molybdotransferase